MSFWDSSALVPLLLEEPRSAALRARGAAERDAITVWWATEAECASALARAEREGRLAAGASADATFQQLRLLAAGWATVEPSPRIMAAALRLLRVYPLRAADALQLAAALAAARGRPDRLALVTLDDRLAAAAAKEGFRVAP